MTRTIGIFGLGLIGKALAARVFAAGWRVVGHDPDGQQMAGFENRGGQPVGPAAVWQADVVLAAVFDTGQLAEIIAAALTDANRTLVATSTCDPDRMPALAHAAAGRNIRLVEAPLSGTSKDLADGRAVFLIGGDGADLDWLFAALGRAHYPVGAIGNGNRAKLAVNLVLGLNRAALAEGLVFAQAVGIDPAGFLALLQDTAAASAVMPSKGQKMVARDFAPLGRIAQSAKDFALIDAKARDAGQTLPFASIYRDMMENCMAAGEAEYDNAAIICAIERAAARD